jgi:hypothetical protein
MAIVRKRQKRRLVDVDKGDLVFELRGSMVDSEKIERWMKRKAMTDTMLYVPTPAPCKYASHLYTAFKSLVLFSLPNTATPQRLVRGRSLSEALQLLALTNQCIRRIPL